MTETEPTAELTVTEEQYVEESIIETETKEEKTYVDPIEEIIAKAEADKTVGFTDAEYSRLKNILETCKKVAAMTRFKVQQPYFDFVPGK